MGKEQPTTGDVVYGGAILDEWIDVNDHMNVAYYVLAFDLAIDGIWQQLGITQDYIRERRLSTFAVESHIEYLRELRASEPIVITTQVLAFDQKRIHQFLRMYHADDGFLAATSEWMNLHVDLNTRRVSNWPGDVLENLETFFRRQQCHDLPDRAGRRIGIKTPIKAVY
ncbi:MAG: thioesterase family protein [Woeseiaceae bacterium]|nr:thioesterase family protein [Woeseiaceae bacterium]